MERLINLCNIEGKDEKEISELIIDHNYIEFHRRNWYWDLPAEFVGIYNGQRAKVFTDGMSDFQKYKSLEDAYTFKVKYVLIQNNDFEVGREVKGIKSLSFFISELVEWLNVYTVGLHKNTQGKQLIIENDVEEIILNKNTPEIKIVFKTSNSIAESAHKDYNSITLSKLPMIEINYKDEVNIFTVRNDIKTVIRFFSLLIGYSSYIDSIVLKYSNCQTSRLYINEDFSYNKTHGSALEYMRTKYDNQNIDVEKLFGGWYKFCNEEKYKFIIKMFFDNNQNKEYFAEDIIVQYAKILEGYYLRENNEEEKSRNMQKEIEKVGKEIKKLIFTDEGKPIFEQVLEKADIDWKYNSAHAQDIANWIANGYLSRKGLSNKLKELDERFFSVIYHNSKYIRDFDKRNIDSWNVYKAIVDTRNYYSHYKADDKGLMNFNQICEAIKCMKALIVMIFYSKMGMPIDSIKKIISIDPEFHMNTMFLKEKKE